MKNSFNEPKSSRPKTSKTGGLQVKVFKKHKNKNLYWSFELRKYVTQNMILIGSLVIDHEGKDISKEVKV